VLAALQPERRAEHVFAYLSGLTALALTYQAGFYSRQIAGGRLQERYLFYIVALFAVGAAAMASERRRVPPVGALLVATVLAVPVIGSAQYPPEVTGVFTLESAASGFNLDLVRATIRIGFGWTVGGTMAAIVVVLVGLTLLAFRAGRFRQPAVGALTGVALLFCVYETHTVVNRTVKQVNNGTIPHVLGSPPKSWVDGLLYTTDDTAGAIEGKLEGDESGLWQWTEFWNTRVERVYVPPSRLPWSLLPGTPLTLDEESGRLETPVELPTLVVSNQDATLSVRGTLIRRIVTGQQLIRPVRPYRAAWAYGGLGLTADVVREPTELSAYPPPGGARTATVSFDLAAAAESKRPVRWIVSGGVRELTGTVSPTGTEHVELKLTVPPGAARAVARINAPDAPPRKGVALVSNVAVEWP
jgi:hypothetical protein